MDKLYTIQEVATKLNLSDKTLRRWEEAGRFTPSRTLGNQRRYSLEDLQILDAIKHGTINEQADLLTVQQASALCGVSPTTILRWEDGGKIHPFITSLGTYYPRQKLTEKMDELKKIAVDPVPLEPEVTAPVEGTLLDRNPRLPAEQGSSADERRVPSATVNTWNPILTNAGITLLLIFAYHLLFAGKPVAPASPAPTGLVQGASTIADPTLDLLKTILDQNGGLTTTSLTSRGLMSAPLLSLAPSSAPLSPTPGTIYYDALAQSLKVFKGTTWSELSPIITYKVADASLVTSISILPKGKNQVSVAVPGLTEATPITITFTTDYSPAKKYWVKAETGSFTLSTDFPVAVDAPFTYSLIAPIVLSPTQVSSSSAIIKP